MIPQFHFSVMYLKELKAETSTSLLYAKVYSSIIYNSQKVETTQVPISR